MHTYTDDKLLRALNCAMIAKKRAWTRKIRRRIEVLLLEGDGFLKGKKAQQPPPSHAGKDKPNRNVRTVKASAPKTLRIMHGEFRWKGGRVGGDGHTGLRFPVCPGEIARKVSTAITPHSP